MNEPLEDPVKMLWRDQEMEDPMTTQAIRLFVRNQGDQIRNRLLSFYALMVVEVGVFGWCAWKAPNELARVGYLLTIGGMAWMIWRFGRRWPGHLPDPSAVVGTLLAFHRSELERRKNSALSMAVTVVPALAGLAIATAGLSRALPHERTKWVAVVFVLMVLWLIGACAFHLREQRQLKKQIDELDALGGG